MHVALMVMAGLIGLGLGTTWTAYCIARWAAQAGRPRRFAVIQYAIAYYAARTTALLALAIFYMDILARNYWSSFFDALLGVTFYFQVVPLIVLRYQSYRRSWYL